MDAAHRQLVKKIRDLTEAKGWTATKLADFADVGRGYLSDVLAGKKSPTLRTMVKLADALDVPVYELLR
jgi:transcriptional regulator with XRE-family HTH domain